MRWTMCMLLFVGCGSRPLPAAPVRASIAVDPAEPPRSEVSREPLLVAGGVVACARTSDRIACWGSWADDVPAGAAFDASAPRLLAPGVDTLALGWTHGCARGEDGRVQCFGRVGATPVGTELPDMEGARALASGRDFTCALDREGRLLCFAGRVYTGLRGYGDVSAVTPVSVPGLAGGWTMLAATTSGWQLCAASPAEVICWSAIDYPPEHVDVAPGVVDLALAPDLGCARWPDGAVRCWSRVGRRWSQAAVVDGVRADALAALHDRVCARTDRAWTCFRPGDVPRPWTAMEGALRVAGGMGFACGLFAGDEIRCAGDDTYGQLGPHAAAPMSVAPPETQVRRTVAADATALVMGAASTCIVRVDGTVACADAGAATMVRVRALGHVAQLGAGNTHTCVRTEGGDVLCWGAMTLDHGEDIDAPLLDLGARPRRLARDATDLVSGTDHACARTGPASLTCWGSLWVIGGGRRVRVALPDDTVAIAAAGEQTCAITGAGAIECFGRGGGGPPGGPFAAVPAWTGASRLVPGSDGCALFDDAVRCWGQNERGQLGDGSRTARGTPTAVLGVDDAIAVAVGDQHACAVLRDGTVRCWGANTAGQLGDGTHEDRWRPVVVPGLHDVVEIAAGMDETCALVRGGRVECWGSTPTEATDAGADDFYR